MKKNLLLAILALSLCFLTSPQNGNAQDWYSNVPDLEVTLDTLRAWEPTPIAVEDPTNETGAALYPSDMQLLLDLAEVIRNDLDFSPLCSLVYIDSLFMKHLELTTMTSDAWKRLGAEYYVKLSSKLSGTKLETGYQVIFTTSGRQVASGRFETDRSAHRKLAHTISDDVMKNVFAETGIFQTKICYITRRGQAKDVYVADYDGANALRILNNGSLNLSPTFTPDGNEVLFTSYVDGDPKLYTFNLRSGKTTLFAGYPGLNTAPTVSPDGDRVACVLSKDGNSEIYLLDRRGRIIRRLTRTRSIESSPSFSPDGQEIVFSSDRSGSPQIYVMDIEGLNVRRLTYEGRYNDSPSWSPRGDLIVFVSRTERGRFDVCTITPTGKDYRILTNRGANENPHFSPDGNSIIFSSTRLGGLEIFTMDSHGRKQRRLTRTISAKDQGSGSSNPTWGPLGQ